MSLPRLAFFERLAAAQAELGSSGRGANEELDGTLLSLRLIMIGFGLSGFASRMVGEHE